jgi:hypothetical protein
MKEIRCWFKMGRESILNKYQPQAYFQSNLERFYFSGYSTVGLTDFSFEIDDRGIRVSVTKYEKESF